MARSKLSSDQIIQTVFDSANEALHTSLVGSMDFNLSSASGDSIYAVPNPSSNLSATTSTTSVGTQVLGPVVVDGLSTALLYAETTVALTGDAKYEIEVSPSASGSDWYKTGNITTATANIGDKVLGMILSVNALRLRVVTGAAHTLSVGSVKLTVVVR